MSEIQSMLSHNGHETNRQLALRNLEIEVGRLNEMRWMIEKAGGNVEAFDQGMAQLRTVFVTSTTTCEPITSG